MFFEILSKLASESLLSLYPVFVKNIGLPLTLQTWSRCFSYALISAFFIDYKFILKELLSYSGILLSLCTIVHIYVSYRGFELLESGVAYSIFYLYPIMILLMANKQIKPIALLAIPGVFLLISNKQFSIMDVVNSPEGFVMILLAAFTEAIIYYLVRGIKTANNWNHIFISYFLGAILWSAYFFKNIINMTITGSLSVSLGINSIIGLFGYLLRFYAISNLDTTLYASLSYFGIVMATVYGVLINGEVFDLKKIIGSLLIIVSSFYLL
jgi:drug/metabolite transporter (DMT)-like permease